MNPLITADDGVQLYYEETGSGIPLLFVHQFAGDWRSWEPQVRHFSRRYRCIAYNARGYPPSDVPQEVERYSQARARDDIRCVLDALGIQRAHIVGLSMGAFATLHFGMAYGYRALSLTIAGCGYGAHPAQHQKFQEDSRALAKLMLEQGMAHTMLGYQARRPSLYKLIDEMARIDVPALIVAGDEDEGSLEASLLMKRTIPTAALAVLPKSGHVLNMEEPAVFNRLLEDFFHQVEAGRWTPRDPAAKPPSIYGPAGKP